MPEILERDPFDPKKICDELIKRCKQSKCWYFKCIVDEAWVPKKSLPMTMKLIIKDGIYYIQVISPTIKQAIISILENIPVLKFLDGTDKK
jgi:hypothetical protein